MAQSTPTTTPPSVRVTVESFLAKWRQRFRDNDQFLIGEADLREHDADMADVFVPYSKLTVNIIRGNHLLLGTLSELPLVDSNVLVVGQPATVANATDAATAATGVEAGVAEFRLLRDSQGPLWAYVDPKPATTQRVRVTWVRTSGSDEDIVASYPQFQPEDYRYKPGDVFQYTYEDGATLLHQVNDPAPTSYVNPLPTGKSDANYTIFAPLPAATLYQLVLTKAALAQQKGLTPGLQYRLTERGFVEPEGDSGGGLVDLEPLPDVVVTAGSNRRFLPEAFTVPAGAVGPFTPVSYDQDADTVSPRQSGGGGGGSGIVDWYNDVDVPAGTTVSIYGMLYRSKAVVPAGQEAPPYYAGWESEWERLRAGADDDTLNRLAELNFWYNKPYSGSDPTTIPNYVSSRLVSYTLNNSVRLLPTVAGVLLWRNGTPVGFYTSFTNAADASANGDTLQVRGVVGDFQSICYVQKNCTVEICAGAELRCSDFNLQYSSNGTRNVDFVGAGYLNAAGKIGYYTDYAHNITFTGLRISGGFYHLAGKTLPRCTWYFRNCRISTSGRATFDVFYQYGGYYKTTVFVWLDGCTVDNADNDLFVPRGGGPGEAGTDNLLRLTKTTVYLAAGKVVANQTGGTVIVEQPAEAGGAAPDLTNYYTKPEADAKFELKGLGQPAGGGLPFVFCKYNASATYVQYTFTDAVVESVTSNYKPDGLAGGLNQTTGYYTFPLAGLYEVLITPRYPAGQNSETGYGFGLGTSAENTDSNADFNWRVTGPGGARNGTNILIKRFFAAGEAARIYFYSDYPVTVPLTVSIQFVGQPS